MHITDGTTILFPMIKTTKIVEGQLCFKQHNPTMTIWYNPTWLFLVGLLERWNVQHMANHTSKALARKWMVLQSHLTNNFHGYLAVSSSSLSSMPWSWWWSISTLALNLMIQYEPVLMHTMGLFIKYLYFIHWMCVKIFSGQIHYYL